MKFILVFCIGMGCNADPATRLLGGAFEVTESGEMTAVLAGLAFKLSCRTVERIARGQNAVAFGGFRDRALMAMFERESGGYRAQLSDIGLMVNGRRVNFIGVEGGLSEQFRRLYCCIQGNGIPYRVSKEGYLVIYTGTGKQLTIKPSDLDSGFPTQIREELSGSGCCVCDVRMYKYNINSLPVSGMRIQRNTSGVDRS